MEKGFEQELLADLRSESKQQEAFRRLVMVYQRGLYRHIRAMTGNHADTDDVLQNVFIKAWRGLGGFRADSSLKTWLYRIATNETFTFLARQKRHVSEGLDEKAHGASFSHAGHREVNSEEIMARFEVALAALPPRQALVFNLRYFEEMPYEQIAEVTGVTVGALKASYHHAVKKLQQLLTLSH